MASTGAPISAPPMFVWSLDQAKLLLEDHLRRDHGCVQFPRDLDGMRHLHLEHHVNGCYEVKR